MKIIHALLLSSVMMIGASTGRGADGAEESRLTVLTYNIRHGAGMDRRMDLERIATVIEKQGADLIALQEVDANCTRSGKQDTAAVLGRRLGMQHRFAAFMEFQGGHYGLAILSRYPIISSRRIPLPPGKHEPRCALEVLVQLPGTTEPFSFVCVHNDWIDETARSAQVRALTEALNPVKRPGIVTGDYNGEGSDASLKLLIDDGWTFVDKAGAKTWPSDTPVKDLDHVAVRGFQFLSANCAVIDERDASDHRPVRATFRMAKPPKR